MAYSTHPEDIMVWSDGTWCYREELEEMSHMSDDFRIIYVDSQEHASFLWAAESMESEDFAEFISHAN